MKNLKHAHIAQAAIIAVAGLLAILPAISQAQSRALTGAQLKAQGKVRVIVAFKKDATARAEGRALIARQGGRVVVELDEVDAVAVELRPAVINLLKNSKHIEFVETDYQQRAFGASKSASRKGPSVSMVSSEVTPYGITQVQANQLPDTHAGNRTLCIIDSGYDISHPDLSLNSVSGENLTSSGQWSTDEASHGTHVAGSIAAIGGNGIGVVGVLPGKKIDLYIAKVFDASGSASSSTIAKAGLRCMKAGANVVSMSLGGAQASRVQQRVFALLAKRNILLIAAAGNDGTTGISYPAGFPGVMSVAAIDESKAWASFSQFNADVEIAGPGVDVLSSVPLGSQTGASTSVGATSYAVQPMDGSPRLTVSAPLTDFGLGDTPVAGSMTGKVCLIARGNIAFADKVTNCTSSGGVGAVIYNNTSGELLGQMGEVVTTIPSVGATQADGAVMLGQVGQSSSVSVFGTNDLYAAYSGTSMATPHVAAVAALVWSYFPTCSAAQIRSTLTKSALDIDVPGRDDKTGSGVVQAKAAYDRLAAMGCAN